MAKPTQSGQIVIETALTALLLVGLFLLAVSISQEGRESLQKNRFVGYGRSR